jgi:hypothetical protein
MDWSNLLTQLPALGAFIWFTLEIQKRYIASMDKRDERYLAVLDKLSDKIDGHDKHVEERVNQAIEQVKPRRRTVKGNSNER